MSSNTTTPDHIAPYEPLPPGSPPSERHIVYFHEGHTFEKHFEAIGRVLRGIQPQKLMYKLEVSSEEEIALIRRDPGVKKVMQSTKAIDWAETRANRSLIIMKYSGFEVAPGYIVMFTSGSYTMDEHYGRIGQKFLVNVIRGTGYSTRDIAESQIDTILSDPNVDHVTQNSYGRWN